MGHALAKKTQWKWESRKDKCVISATIRENRILSSNHKIVIGNKLKVGKSSIQAKKWVTARVWSAKSELYAEKW